MNAIVKFAGNIGKSFMKLKPVAKVVAKASKNKPELMAIGGGAMVLTAFWFAIRAGMKVGDRMEISASKVEELEKRKAEQLNVDDLTEEQKNDIIRQCNKDLGKARADGIWQVAKLFILPGGLLVVGLVLIGGGHRILKKRNVVLAAAAEGYKKTLEFYRKNVVEAEGKEADLKYMRGVIGEKEIETVTKDAEGKENKSKDTLPVVKAVMNHDNPWRFTFDEHYFGSWEDDTDRNLFFLKCAQEWWQRQYDQRGVEGISIYEVLQYLGYNFEMDKAAMTKEKYREWLTFLRNYGWRKGSGDDFIDFGLYRAINEPATRRQSDFVYIEFNCNGNLQNLSIKDDK